MGKLSETIELIVKVVSGTSSKDLKKTTTDVKQLGDAANASSGKVDKAGKAVEKLGKASDATAKDLKKVTKESTNVVDVMQGGLGKIAAFGSALLSLAMPVIQSAQFERKISEIAAITGATGESLQRLSDTAEEMGAKTEFSATQAADGLRILGAAGLTAEQSIAAIKPTLDLALVGETDLAGASDALINIMGGLRLGVGDLTRIADVLAKTANSTTAGVMDLAHGMSYAAPAAAAVKVPLEEVAAVLGVLTDNGIKGQRAGNAFRAIVSDMVNVEMATDKAKNALKDMDVEMTINEDGSLNLSDSLRKLAAAGMNLSQANAIFGQEYGTAALIMAASVDKIDQVTNANEAATGAAKEMAALIADNVVGAWKNFQSATEGLSIQLGKVFLPILRVVLDALSGFLSGISSLMKEFPILSGGIELVIAGFLAWKVASLAAGFAMKGIGPAMAMVGVNVTGLSASLLAARTAMTATVTTFALANPVIAGLVAVLAIGGAAWLLFGKSSLESSEAHSKAATDFRKAGEGIDAETKSLEALQKRLQDTAPDSEEHLAAERELANLLPEVNVSFDEQGRIIAKVGDATSENAKKLQEMIDKQKEMAGINLASQFNEQKMAVMDAKDAIAEQNETLRIQFGLGEQNLSWAQKINRAFTADDWSLQTKVKELGGMQENLKKVTEEYKVMAKSALSLGMTSDNLAKSLDDIGASAGVKDAVIAEYKAWENELKGLGTAAEASGTAQKKAFKEVTEEAKKEYQELARVAKGALDDIANRQQSLTAQLRDMSRSGMSDFDAWTDLKKEADEYATAARNAMSAGDFQGAITAADAARAKYAQLNTEVKEGDKVLVDQADAQKTAMDGVKAAGDLAVEAQKKVAEEAKTTAKALNAATGGELAKESVEAAAIVGDSVEGVTKKVAELGKNAAAEGKAALESLAADIDKVVDKTYTIKFKAEKTGSWPSDAQANSQGGLMKFATGGFARMAGKLAGFGGGDKIKSLLEPGEFIMRKEAVQRYGVRLMHMLNGMSLPVGGLLKAATGGFIPKFNMPVLQPLRFAAGGLAPAVAGGSGGDVFHMNFSFVGEVSQQSKVNARQNAAMIMQEFEQMNRRKS